MENVTFITDACFFIPPPLLLLPPPRLYTACWNHSAPGTLASPASVQAPVGPVSALVPADLKELSGMSGEAVTSRGGAGADVDKPKSQTVIVGIYFFLWCGVTSH